MLKHLISLVFLFITFTCLPSFSDSGSIILPKIKPKVFSKPIKNLNTQILPIKKPRQTKEETQKKLLIDIHIQFVTNDEGEDRVFLNTDDVTEDIRSNEISQLASSGRGERRRV